MGGCDIWNLNCSEPHTAEILECDVQRATNKLGEYCSFCNLSGHSTKMPVLSCRDKNGEQENSEVQNSRSVQLKWENRTGTASMCCIQTSKLFALSCNTEEALREAERAKRTSVYFRASVYLAETVLAVPVSHLLVEGENGIFCYQCKQTDIHTSPVNGSLL